MSIFSKLFGDSSSKNTDSKKNTALEITFSLNTVYFLKDANDDRPSDGIYGGLISSLKGTKLGNMLSYEIDDETLESILGVSKLTSFKVDGRPVMEDYVLTGEESRVMFYASGDDKG